MMNIMRRYAMNNADTRNCYPAYFRYLSGDAANFIIINSYSEWKYEV